MLTTVRLRSVQQIEYLTLHLCCFSFPIFYQHLYACKNNLNQLNTPYMAHLGMTNTNTCSRMAATVDIRIYVVI